MNERKNKLMNHENTITEWPQVYAVKHKNFEIRMASRSGGAFTAFSDYILEAGGIVYGCILTEDFKAIHIRAYTRETRDKMRGSKYIQSNLLDTFQEVKEDLEAGKKVLFSGTSCQIAGLKSFLQMPYENLLCIDIVCHGVPSTKVWKKYLAWQEKRNKEKCVNVNFRNKCDYGWAAHVETLTFESGKSVNSQIFKKMFYDHTILRPCCYKCPYKSIIHPGDITIADYWGIEKAAPGFSDNKGVSLVLINNQLGVHTFKNVKEMIEYKKCRIEDSMQQPLVKPFESPINREKFWKDFESRSFDYIVRKYGGQGVDDQIKRKFHKLKLCAKTILRMKERD